MSNLFRNVPFLTSLEVSLFFWPAVVHPDDHYHWPSICSTRPITPDIRSQSSVSFANCFRPFFVIE